MGWAISGARGFTSRGLRSPAREFSPDAVKKLFGLSSAEFTFMPVASAETLDWFDDFQRQTTSPKNAARFQEAFGRIDVRHRLGQVKAPTIVLHSRYDQRIPLELGQAVAAGIPGAQFVALESRNHILVDQEPAWQVCLGAIHRFLEENGI